MNSVNKLSIIIVVTAIGLIGLIGNKLRQKLKDETYVYDAAAIENQYLTKLLQAKENVYKDSVVNGSNVGASEDFGWREESTLKNYLLENGLQAIFEEENGVYRVHMTGPFETLLDMIDKVSIGQNGLRIVSATFYAQGDNRVGLELRLERFWINESVK